MLAHIRYGALTSPTSGPSPNGDLVSTRAGSTSPSPGDVRGWNPRNQAQLLSRYFNHFRPQAANHSLSFSDTGQLEGYICRATGADFPCTVLSLWDYQLTKQLQQDGLPQQRIEFQAVLRKFGSPHAQVSPKIFRAQKLACAIPAGKAILGL